MAVRKGPLEQAVWGKKGMLGMGRQAITSWESVEGRLREGMFSLRLPDGNDAVKIELSGQVEVKAMDSASWSYGARCGTICSRYACGACNCCATSVLPPEQAIVSFSLNLGQGGVTFLLRADSQAKRDLWVKLLTLACAGSLPPLKAKDRKPSTSKAHTQGMEASAAGSPSGAKEQGAGASTAVTAQPGETTPGQAGGQAEGSGLAGTAGGGGGRGKPGRQIRTRGGRAAGDL